MKTKNFIIPVALIFVVQFAFSQHTISGHVYDETTLQFFIKI